MKNNETLSQESIRRYIEDEHNPGALLVTGEWGSGKTFFLKNLAKEFNKTNKYVIGTISLFGLSSSEEIEKYVKTELCYVFAAPKSKDKDKNTTNKLIKGLKVLTGHFKEDCNFIGAIDNLVNFNYLDFIDLSPIIKNRKVILIFDDLERCTIDIELLLGIINEYSENIGIKVILVADEKKLVADEKKLEEDSKFAAKYKKFKEKVIYKTIKMELQTEDVIGAIIDNYKAGDSDYQSYLKANINSIITIFDKSEYNNFRSIKIAINDFYKVYELFLKTTKYISNNKFKPNKEKALSFLLKQFLVLTLETCAGNDVLSDLDKEFEAGLTGNEKSFASYLRKYRNIPDYNLNFHCIDFIMPWIAEGIYNEEGIINYINLCISYFTIIEKNALEKFLYDDILDFEDDLFQNGYKAALEKAYSGDLTCEQYLIFIDRAFFSEKIGIIEKPNYELIKKGFMSKDRIYEKKEFSPSSVYCTLEEYDSKTKELFNLISTEKLNIPTKRAQKEYYDKCLKYFSEDSNPNISRMMFEDDNTIVIELTDELMAAFIESYLSANNHNRIVLAKSFNYIKFSYNDDRKQIKKFVEKLTALKSKPELGKIGKVNLERFIQKIKEY